MKTMPQEWRTLPAGRALDALIAEHVMGWQTRTREEYDLGKWTVHEYLGEYIGLPRWKFIPLFSKHMDAAHLALEALRSRGFGVVISSVRTDEWQVEVDRASWTGSEVWSDGLLPLAICRAALAATEATADA